MLPFFRDTLYLLLASKGVSHMSMIIDHILDHDDHNDHEHKHDPEDPPSGKDPSETHQKFQ